MRSCRHRSRLRRDNKSTTSKGNKDLAHDQISDVGVRLPEMDHQTNSQNGHWDAEVHVEPLETSRPTHQSTDNKRPGASSDAVDVGHVGSVPNTQVEDNLKKRGEIAVPDVPAEKDENIHQRGAQHRPVSHQLEGYEGNGCEEGFVESKDS